MKLYADATSRRTRQILADVGMVVWLAVWVWVGRQVHDTIAGLRGSAESIEQAGASAHDSLAGAAAVAGQLPFVGTDLQQTLDRAAAAGSRLGGAGRSMATTVDALSGWLGWSTALIPVLIVGAVWVGLRGRFIRRATSAQEYIDATEDLDLFALRAMVRRPMSELARISPDPAGAWRRRDPELVRALAVLELHDEGLRPPTPS